MTSQFICTPNEASNGVHYCFHTSAPPPSAPFIFTFDTTDVGRGFVDNR